MERFNVFGLVFIVVIMIPNIVFAVRYKDGFENRWNNTVIEIIEQIGRFGCFGFMIFNVPGTWFGWWSDETFAIYLIIDSLLIALYCAILTATTVIIVIDIMCDKSRSEVALIADCSRIIRNIQILGENKGDAANGHVTAALTCMRWDGHHLHTAFVLESVGVHLV